MIIDLDDALSRLASDARHRVLGAIGSRRAAGIGAGATLAAMAFALTLGAVSNLAPVTEARASPLSPLGVPSALAPSTLLGEIP